MASSAPQARAAPKAARRSLADLAAGSLATGTPEAIAQPGATAAAPALAAASSLAAAALAAAGANRMAKYPSATVYLPPRAIRLLKEIALEENRKLTDILAEALNAWLVKNGHSSLEQLGR